MTSTIDNASAVIMVDAFVDQANSGPWEILIRSGSSPGLPSNASTGDVLATFELAEPAFGAAGDEDPGAQADLLDVPLTDSSADNTGTAGHGELVTEGGAVKGRFSVSATGQGGDVELNTTSIVAGQPVQLTAFNVFLPETE